MVMMSLSELEVLDLRHFSARQLRPLLEEEGRVWAERLRWDYRSSTELLLQYLDSRVLPGLVALCRGRICGYAFCVYEGNKAVVGDAYALQDELGGPLHVEDKLLSHLIEMLQNSPNISRIESQLLLHDSGEMNARFVAAGFAIYPRLFLECSFKKKPRLPLLRTGEAAPVLPSHLKMQAWSNANYQAAGELIHACYQGHMDSTINDQYRTLHGSLRFLHNIVRFPGCGTFDPESSVVLVDQRTGVLEGMVLCSRVSAEMGHITQICVAPHLRGNRYGRMLLQQCAMELARRGFDGITLTVTEANRHAINLYEELGFVVRHRFDAMVWNRDAASV